MKRSRGFGFVVFQDESYVESVVQNGHVIIDNKNVEVKRIDERSSQEGKQELESRKIFVGGLPDDVTSESLKAYFLTALDPDVKEARVMVHQDGSSRCFGYVTLSSKEMVDKALAMREQHFINNKWIDVKASVLGGTKNQQGGKGGKSGKGGKAGKGGGGGAGQWGGAAGQWGAAGYGGGAYGAAAAQFGYGAQNMMQAAGYNAAAQNLMQQYSAAGYGAAAAAGAYGAMGAYGAGGAYGNGTAATTPGAAGAAIDMSSAYGASAGATGTTSAAAAAYGAAGAAAYGQAYGQQRAAPY